MSDDISITVVPFAAAGFDEIKLSLSSSLSVADLQAAIREELEIPVWEQQLVNGLDPLPRDMKLSDIGASDGAGLTLNLVRMSLSAANGCATGDEDARVRIWDLSLEHCSMKSELAFGDDAFYCVDADFDVGQIIGGDASGRMFLWNLSSEVAPAELIGHTDSVTSVRMSCRHQRAISASGDETLILWDLQGLKQLSQLRGPSAPVRDVAVNFDMGKAVSAGWDGGAHIWELEHQGFRRLEGGTCPTECVAVDWHSGQIVVGEMSGTLLIGNLNSPGFTELSDIDTGFFLHYFAFDTSRKRLLVSGRSGLSMYDFVAGKTAWICPEKHFKHLVLDSYAGVALGVGPSGLELIELDGGRVLRSVTDQPATMQCCCASGMT